MVNSDLIKYFVFGQFGPFSLVNSDLISGQFGPFSLVNSDLTSGQFGKFLLDKMKKYYSFKIAQQL